MPKVGRGDQLRRLRREAFDVLVIGGGITGAAIARDAARRGFRTALVEARDFGEGTSSRSSRLVHGGLRYLEHFELDLVFEASQERRRLLRIAPHLVRPLEFLFPIYRDGRVGKVKLDAGMWLYDALSLFRNIERHQMLDREEVLDREPRLRREGLLGGARYFDAQVDDARLVLATVLSAVEAGAAAANRLDALGLETEKWPGHSARVRDAETGEEWTIDALSVAIAAGPWTDETLERIGVETGPMLHPSRGTHLHVERARVGHDRAFIFESPLDGRIMFVLPWRDLTLIGTTDEFDDGPPEEVAPTAADVQYLLESTNHLLPEAKLTPEDVLGAWAGLRPLVAAPGGEAEAGEGDVSRDFVVREEPPGVFTVTGGKLTSHRAMGEETVDRLAAFLRRAGVKNERKCDTDRVALPGGDFEEIEVLRAHARRRAADLGVSMRGADRLCRAYGTRADQLLDLVRAHRELSEPLCPGRPHIAAEAVYAARAELAVHVEDVVYRRTRIALETRDGFEAACRRTASLMASELGWTPERVSTELERTRRVRERNEAFRAADVTRRE